MDERSAVFIDLFEIDDELFGIVFSVCENFSPKECNDMIRDHFGRFILWRSEVSVCCL
jgi:hypothetical protein